MRCSGASQGAQVQTSLCRKSTSGLVHLPRWTSGWCLAHRRAHQTRNVTQPAYPLRQCCLPSPCLPLPCLVVQQGAPRRSTHHCTTQPNATLARPDLLNRLLLAFDHLLAIILKPQLQFPTPTSDLDLSTPFLNFRAYHQGSLPLSPFQPSPDIQTLTWTATA